MVERKTGEESEGERKTGMKKRSGGVERKTGGESE